jgi:glycerol-3-phosphate dehydrogenase (NAD(P)+)
MGDLVATCASRKSRNYRLGFEVARGKKLAEVLAEMNQVAEGVETTRAAQALAARANVEMPITAAVHSVLFEGASAAEAVRVLMERVWKDEAE